MSIKHHLDEATLLSYSAGSMSQAMALVVACHISMCSKCHKRIQESEALGGMLLDNLEPAKIDADSLSQVLSCLEQGSADAPDISTPAAQPSPVHIENQEIPAPLRDYIGGSLDALDWKSIVPGVHYYDLDCKTERNGASRLLRIAPGKAMLPHSHDGNELTLILRGSYSDEMGRFTVGDIADLDSEVEHQPLVDSHEDCICLIATDAPLKFSTLLGKIVQPMTGF